LTERTVYIYNGKTKNTTRSIGTVPNYNKKLQKEAHKR